MITKRYNDALLQCPRFVQSRYIKNLRPGLLESIYEKCLKYELERSGYDIKQQVLASIIYDDLCFDTELKLDLLVNDLICVELKLLMRLSLYTRHNCFLI